MEQARFLICHRGALGDFLLTWPALRALRRRLPSHRFVGIGRPAHLRLARRYGLLDEGLDHESARLLDFFRGRGLPLELGAPAGGVLWLRDGTDAARLLQQGATLPVACLPPFPADRQPVAAFHLSMLRRFFPLDSSMDEDFSLAANRLGYGLIHPGSGSPAKNYSPALYRQSAEALQAGGLAEVRILLGPAEASYPLEQLAGLPVVRPENLETLAALLEEAAFFLGNDSGVSHLAGLLGVPTLTLYKTTDPAVWGTIGPRAANLRAADDREAQALITRWLPQLLHHAGTR